MNNAHDPHADGALLTAGAPLETAKAVMVMAHGRGASAQSILELADAFGQPSFAYVAPQANGLTWYPNSFLYPLEANEPYLSSALKRLDAVVEWVRGQGFGTEHIMLLGFSQGACLSLEYAARHVRRYGGVVGLSGGLIGPEGTPRDYAGTLAGTPVFLGCSDTDFHIPKGRVLESASVFGRMGAAVTTRLYPNMGHGINADEVAFVQGVMAAIL